MAAIIQANSKITWQKEREGCTILMEIITMENGKKIKQMDTDNINHRAEENMKAIGCKTKDTVKENKVGQMELNSKATTNPTKKVGMANFSILTETFI
jgi:hypothetical protein